MKSKSRFLILLLLSISGTLAFSQAPAIAPYGLLPNPVACFTQGGVALAGGFVFSYQAGTSTPWPTYTDSSGLVQNSNPVMLDANGCAQIWLGAAAYKIIIQNSLGAQVYVIDQVANLGATTRNLAVLLAPAGGSMQTITGPLTASYFQGSTNHFTSPNVRVSLLDPVSTLDTATNPPTLTTTAPANPGQNITIPDPGASQANVVLSPGTSTNTLDCTQAGITCKRTANVWFEGGGCNNATAALGWDTFGTNAPTPICVTGGNVQKGVLALPSALTPVQSNTGTGSAATTVTTTYTNTTTAGNLLVATITFNSTTTITGCTDGTNAYTQAKHVANGALSVDVWYFNGSSTSKSAGTTLTCTFSVAASSALIWHEYTGNVTASIADQTASNTGSGTAVTTGTTAGTAQAPELLFPFVGALINTTVTGGNGFSNHGAVVQSTNVTVSEGGAITNSVGTFFSSFTLGTSATWAAGIVTFKANAGNSVTAQRGWLLPASFRSADPINATLLWQAPLLPQGTVNVALGAQLVCTAAGNSDDPTFLTETLATPLVNISAANIVTSTALSNLTATGCAAGNLMHFQIRRDRYSSPDIYEGYVYLNGANLSFGISQ